MSFTNEELQSFNTILEQKLNQQRRELERTFDQRLQVVKRELEQRLISTHKDLVRVVSQHLSEQYKQLKELVHQRDTIISEATNSSVETIPDLSNIELDTEIPLEDLAEAVNQALDTRFSSLDTSLKEAATSIEGYLATEIQSLRAVLTTTEPDVKGIVSVSNMTGVTDVTDVTEIAPLVGTITNMQDVFTSIERLEHIIESMQVAVTSNSALLSNRLYHHQQLPLERAHPGTTARQS